MQPAPDDAPEPLDFRWQAFFQHADEPLFLLNRRRRLLFANRAWERLTGLRFADVRGKPCRRRAHDAAEREEQILAALAPPAEALQGRTCQVRRRTAWAGAGWWQLGFFPLRGSDGPLGVLGKIADLTPARETTFALPEKLMQLRDRQAAHYSLDRLVSETPALRRVREQARLAAQTRLPLTLVGAAGTGKHWLARAIHLAGPGRQAYFARLDCGRLPASALADVLFAPGPRRLALGTLYLHEPSDLPRELQERLVQLLQAETADGPRWMAGYRDDPLAAVQAGTLLEELYCLLSPLTVELPPLRERLADLDGWIDAFLNRARAVQEHDVRSVSTEALTVLRSHAWPGNLRELYDVLLAAVGRAKGERLEAADLPFHLRHGPLPAEKTFPLDELLEQAERRLILLALRLARNNRTKAAELLHVWRPRLIRRLEHFGIDAGEEAT